MARSEDATGTPGPLKESRWEGPLVFDQLIFSGGGTRCFWQGGFLDVVRRGIDLDPSRIASVSGGALGAAAYIAHRGNDLLALMKGKFAAQDRNVTWHDLTDDDGLSPHQRIYREVAEELLDADTIRKIVDGPSYEVLLGHPPGDSESRAAGILSTLVYEVELHLINAPHFGWAEKLGLSFSKIDARQAARDGQLADLVVAAAAIPPVFDMPRWNDRPVVDGGMADQAPMPSDDHGATLVMLTRDYDRLPAHDDRLYVGPSEETPADKIDFTDPDKIQRTWDIGRRDGEAFLKAHGI